jgi:hypothetical protein
VLRGLDQTAREREQSHVDGETLDHIRSIILEEHTPPEPTLSSARRLVPRLSHEELAQVLADWLDDQPTI